MTKSAASASLPVARDAAEQALAANGSAADAIVAAYFAMAGDDASALFAPAVAIVAGAGALGRAFDGRAQQPGFGVARPRGFTGAVPLAARAAVPRAPQAMLLLHATFGRRSLREVVRPGVSLAEGLGAEKRARFLERFADVGALAIRGEQESILRAAGPLASGLLTEGDLDSVRVEDEPAEIVEAGEGGEVMRVVLEPWSAAEGSGLSPVVVTAVDARGLVAALAVFARETPDRSRLLVPEIETALPLVADPVLRGIARTQPGTIFGVPNTLWAVDCGASLRAAGACERAMAAGRDGLVIAAALKERPLEAGLARLAGAAPMWVSLATSHDARALAAGGP